MDLDSVIWKHALKNAWEHGKAMFKPVLNKVLGENPELRANVGGVAKRIKEIVAKVNTLSREEIEAKLREIWPEVFEQEKKGYELPDLPHSEKVVTVFPPEPSKYPHIGHAKACALNWYYAQKYKGTFIIRFEDTNPRKVKAEYYDAMKEYLIEWLGLRPNKIDIESKHMEAFYKAGEQLIKEGKAYVCTCPEEKVRESRLKGVGCEHRNQSVQSNLELWEKMFDEGEGFGIVRLKIDLNHPNATMRDPTIFRIVEHPHPIVGDKYTVWPTYDFATSVMDGIEGITHRIRSKEFEIRNELQNWIRDALGIEKPYVVEFARFNFRGAPSSGRVIRQLLEKGVLKGWDDPRLTTLPALKRRGFLPEAILDFVIHTGLSKAEGIVEWKVLESINRKYLDPKAKRVFFVANPKKIVIRGLNGGLFKLPFHPEKSLGFREIFVRDAVFIDGDDAKELKEGDVIRLKGLCNVRILKKDGEMLAEYAGNEIVKQMKKIQWVPDDHVLVEVEKAGELLDDAGNVKEDSLQVVWGYGERTIEKLIGEVVQFERFGFVKLDGYRDKTVKAIFTHD